MDTVQPTGEFPSFGIIPKELRLLIWEEALRQESAERIILLDGEEPENPERKNPIRVLPFRSLVSPFLTVDSESRACALKVYNTALNVFRLPTFRENIGYNNAGGKFDLLKEAETTLNYVGVVHVSLHREVFLFDFKLTPTTSKNRVDWRLSCQHTFFSDAPYCVRMFPRLFTQPLWPVQSRVKCILSNWTNALLDAFARGDSYVDMWFPLCYPRLELQYWNIAGFLTHLCERRPGDPLEEPYRRRHLALAKVNDDTEGQAQHE